MMEMSYSSDLTYSMFEKTIKKLIERKLPISFAESCTGGNLAATLTKCPGVSSIFAGSFVTYSNEFKCETLGVNMDTINKFGVVSSEVAKEMVIGLKKKINSDICVSVTGNAGPTQGDEREPLGRVYVGVYFKDDLEIYELNLKGTRCSIIKEITKFVYEKIEWELDK